MDIDKINSTVKNLLDKGIYWTGFKLGDDQLVPERPKMASSQVVLGLNQEEIRFVNYDVREDCVALMNPADIAKKIKKLWTEEKGKAIKFFRRHPGVLKSEQVAIIYKISENNFGFAIKLESVKDRRLWGMAAAGFLDAVADCISSEDSVPQHRALENLRDEFEKVFEAGRFDGIMFKPQ